MSSDLWEDMAKLNALYEELLWPPEDELTFQIDGDKIVMMKHIPRTTGQEPMNIFVVDRDPIISARQLPDRHVTKMILESCQMLSIVFSKHYWDIGQVMKDDFTDTLQD